MKKIILLFCLLLAVIQLSIGQSLTTTYADNNSQNGIMFDVVAINDVTVTNFDHNLDDRGSNIDIEIYTKTGPATGFEDNPSAWTLIAQTTVDPQGSGNPTPIPAAAITPVQIPAGNTQAFYITATNTNELTLYTNGTFYGNVFVQDANIQILEGIGKGYPFGANFRTRVWNGTIYYQGGLVDPVVDQVVDELPTMNRGVLFLFGTLILGVAIFGMYNYLKS